MRSLAIRHCRTMHAQEILIKPGKFVGYAEYGRASFIISSLNSTKIRELLPDLGKFRGVKPERQVA